VISFPKLEPIARGGHRFRFFAAAMCVGMSVLAVQAQEKRRGIAGRGDFEDSPAPPPNAGAQPGNAGPASVPKFEAKPRTLPGAVVVADPKLAAGAPFDTKNYFFMPAEDENAGPLVLDALADFPEVYAVLESADTAGLEQRRKNLKTAQDWLQANPNPRNWDANAIEQALGPYRTTFAKLHEAHKRPDCVIPTGIGIDTLLPHVQASRALVDISAPLIFADLSRGDENGAIAKFEDALRLGQDLQPRSAVITALVISVNHRKMAESSLPILLNAKGLKKSDYDAILAALKGYRSGSINLLPEALKTEYLSQAKILDGLTATGGVDKFVEMTKLMTGGAPAAGNDESTKKLLTALFTPETVQKLKSGVARTIKAQLAAIGDIGSVDDIRKIGAELDSIGQSTAAEALAEVLDKEMIARLAEIAGGSNPALAEVLKKAATADPKTVASLVGPQLGLNIASGISTVITPLLYFQNDQGMMESLTAIRRWYVTKKSVPNDKSLDEICKEAGLESAPQDIFTGKPMRMVWTQSGPAVLTAGHDFKDDDGKSLISRADRGKPDATGDLVETLALGGNPSLASQSGNAPGQAPGTPAGFGPAGPQGGQSGAIRPPGTGASGSGGSGGRRGRAEGGTAIEP